MNETPFGYEHKCYAEHWSVETAYNENTMGWNIFWLSIFFGIGILLPKLFWPTVRKNCSSDREKLLKFEAEGQEFAKCLR